jgi:CHRD domain/PEP-CTERM motif
MMKRTMVGLTFLLGIALVTPPAHATLITFTATLDGSQQVPPNASIATGFGTVVLDDVADTMKVDLSWQNLTGPALAAHIHGPGAVGTNAAILFPFTDVPAVMSGSIPEQTIPITPAQIADLEAGLYYMNIHTAMFPLGEIRGQLTQVPEPGTLALVATGAFALVVGAKRRRTRA